MCCEVYKHRLLSCSLCGLDIESGSLVPIPSLAEREAQGPEVTERGVLTPALSLAHCHFGHVLLPGWTSDISAANEDIGSKGF